MQAVASFIKELPKLRSLNMAGSLVGDSGACVLAHALQGKFALRELDLSKTGMTDEGAAVLIAALDAVFVRKLHLHGNRGIVQKQAEIFQRPGVHME